MTNSALITCDLLYLDNLDDEDSAKNTTQEIIKFLFEQTVNMRNNQIAKKEAENPDLKLINDSSMIVIKEGTIKTFANPKNIFKISNFLLFTDQIIGISFGDESLIDL